MNAIVIEQSSPRKYHEIVSLAFILLFYEITYFHLPAMI